MRTTKDHGRPCGQVSGASSSCHKTLQQWQPVRVAARRSTRSTRSSSLCIPNLRITIGSIDVNGEPDHRPALVVCVWPALVVRRDNREMHWGGVGLAALLQPH
jgi:hypothetical protein